MKIKIALCLLAVALVPACTTTTQTTSRTTDAQSATSYANNATTLEAAPPAEGPEADIPAEGPANVATNPAYVPSPLLRRSAATGP